MLNLIVYIYFILVKHISICSIYLTNEKSERIKLHFENDFFKIDLKEQFCFLMGTSPSFIKECSCVLPNSADYEHGYVYLVVLSIGTYL